MAAWLWTRDRVETVPNSFTKPLVVSRLEVAGKLVAPPSAKSVAKHTGAQATPARQIHADLLRSALLARARQQMVADYVACCSASPSRSS